MRISLACYTVRLRKKGSGDYLPLGELSPNEGLLEVFREYFRGLRQGHSEDTRSRKLLRVIKLLKPKGGRLIRGVVNAGRYGYGAELFNVESRHVSHNRTPVEAEMMPFYFLVDLPPIQPTGLLVLQRRGPFGIRTDLLQDFDSHLNRRRSDVRIEVRPLMTPELLDQQLGNGRFTKLKLIRRVTSRDITAFVANGSEDDETDRVEITYSSGRNRRLRLHEPIMDVIRGKRRIEELVELPEFRREPEVEYIAAKAEIVVEGTRRTIDLINPMKMRGYYDITTQVSLDPDGHPIFESIDEVAIALRAKLLSQLGKGGIHI